jgi:hypothetical protein
MPAKRLRQPPINNAPQNLFSKGGIFTKNRNGTKKKLLKSYMTKQQYAHQFFEDISC